MRMAGDDLHLHGEYLRNCWYVAAWAHELIDGRLLARTILDQPILLYKGDSGRVVALDDRCCHRGARLSKGRLEGDCVRCMYHGLKFDGSGACVQIPGQDTVPKGLGVRSYPTVERDQLVWIWSGDAAKADPAGIVDFPVPARAGLARRARLPALRRQLPADRRQPRATSRTWPSSMPSRWAARKSTPSRPSRSRWSASRAAFASSACT